MHASSGFHCVNELSDSLKASAQTNAPGDAFPWQTFEFKVHFKGRSDPQVDLRGFRFNR